jgi:hypothetical protein
MAARAPQESAESSWQIQTPTEGDDGDDAWILHVPADRFVQGRRRPSPLTVVRLLAAWLLSYLVAPPLLVLTGTVWRTDAWSQGLTRWIMEGVPRLAAGLLALQMSLCLGYAGWQYLVYSEYDTQEKHEKKGKVST